MHNDTIHWVIDVSEKASCSFLASLSSSMKRVAKKVKVVGRSE
jgi:hypothetical protein